ncbi:MULTISPECIES: response regulator [Pseudoalteromonas]|uniref:Two-component system response regulator n=1 Tax=Pseudoalteromonas amylolytica TaxID=1859457 RepID=A0A1S1MTB3_9GAMM|nr:MULTISPECIES: response regulator [Pseudoalteromonas]OHU85080.1 two-component system response regulator [Pseudoalteromonas sp. JW3]OHU89968.1 two-component system response regulator [Pseudoalteromonas amylolytica]
MRILVVDDMPLMRHVMINMLRRLEYEDIVEATDGQQAIKLLKASRFDLLITDLNMPKMNGKMLIDKIRKELNQPHLAILVVTCDDNKDTVLNLISAKIDGLMVKPFNLQTLQKQLRYTAIRHDKQSQ